GAAARAAIALESAGFTVSGTGDTPETNRTTIRHGEDTLAHAQLLDRALVGGADLVLDDTVTSSDVVLVLGADYDGLSIGPVSPVAVPSTTTTTSAAGTGSTTTTPASTTTAPPTTLGTTTLPPGVEC
ncbi:MAG TPA: LytR C-terminal domain-containing protein, partial [Acidimicrobiales bacterium]